MSTDQVFGRGAAAFYRGLAADNSRDYFEAHRDVYQRAIRVPLEDLADIAPPSLYGDLSLEKRTSRFGRKTFPGP